MSTGRKTPALLTEDDVKCPICLYILVEPVRLPCTHCLCRNCFDSTIKQTALQCPVCRTRIGTFVRKALKQNKLVDVAFWKQIQKQFKEQLSLQKMNTRDRQRRSETCKPVFIEKVGVPGDIRKEFEEQIKKLQHPARTDQEIEDEKLARRLQKELNDSITTRQSSHSPANCSYVSETDSEKESSKEEESDEEEVQGNRKASRKLFQSLCNSSSEEIDADKEMPKEKKKQCGKENSSRPLAKRKQKKMIMKSKTKQFPGCSLKPIIDGTEVLPNDDSILVNGEKNDDSIVVNGEKNELSCNEQDNAVQNTSNNKIIKPKVTKRKNNQIDNSEASCSTQTSMPRKKKSKNNDIDRNFSDIVVDSETDSSNKPHQRNYTKTRNRQSKQSATLIKDGSSKSSNADLDTIAAVLKISEGVDVAALLAEQQSAEARLKQEQEDQKLAKKLQKQLEKFQVDRTFGSGEEYGLRSRRRVTSNSDVTNVTVTSLVDMSPTY